MTTTLGTYNAPNAISGIPKSNAAPYRPVIRLGAYDWYDLKPPLPIPVFTLTPSIATDTIRGGATLVMGGSILLSDTSQDVSFESQTLPVGWTATTTGVAGVSYSNQGTVLAAGPNTNASVTLASPQTYLAFDAALTVQILAPNSAPSNSNGPVDCIDFGFYVDVNNYVVLRARKWVNATGTSSGAAYVDVLTGYTTGPVESGSVLLSGASGSVGLAGSSSAQITLNIVRSLTNVSCFVNGQLIFQTCNFSQNSPGAVGQFQITTASNTSQTKAISKVYGLTVRSHVLIDGRLLQNKTDFGTRRIIGTVPPATLSDLGPKPIIIFGPWGSQTLPNSFTYTLPPGLPLGFDLLTAFEDYSDPAVFT